MRSASAPLVVPSSSNSSSLAICALGNYEVDQPTPALIDAIVARIVHARRSGALAPGFTIEGHRDTNPTACPGRHLYAALPGIRQRVAAALTTAPPPPPSVLEDPMLKRVSITQKVAKARTFGLTEALVGESAIHWLWHPDLFALADRPGDVLVLGDDASNALLDAWA
jgi:hypothetical protein